MKLLKKWVAGVAVASSGLLAASPASATIYMEFFDGTNTPLFGLSYTPDAAINFANFNGKINGWTIGTSIGGSVDGPSQSIGITVSARYTGEYPTSGSFSAQNPNFSWNLTDGSLVYAAYGSPLAATPLTTETSPTVAGGVDVSTQSSVASKLIGGGDGVNGNRTLKVKIIDDNVLTNPQLSDGQVINIAAAFSNTSSNPIGLIGGTTNPLNVQVNAKVNGNVLAYTSNVLSALGDTVITNRCTPLCGSGPQEFNPVPSGTPSAIQPGSKGGTNLNLSALSPSTGPWSPILLATQLDFTDDPANSGQLFTIADTVTITVPEPGTVALLGLALVGAGFFGRKKKGSVALAA